MGVTHRFIRLLRLAEWALVVLGADEAERWMMRPLDVLDGQSPFNAAYDSDDGWRRAAAILNETAKLANKRVRR